eukprot:m.113814 g.113814  ORF g.113814 m.113814 type:complete len:502 (-) comp14148_c0_seq4:478-1983(-)
MPRPSKKTEEEPQQPIDRKKSFRHRILRGSKQGSKKKVKKKLFGAPLEEAPHADGVPIPLPFRACVDFIEAHGMTQLGLYRVPGQKSRVTHLREQFDLLKPVSLEREGRSDAITDDVNVVASLLKLYLRELPTPLIMNTEPFVAATKLASKDEQMSASKDALATLTLFHYSMLGALCRHLCNVASYCEDNHMDVSNLVVSFHPTTQLPSIVLQFLVENADVLFADVSMMPCNPMSYAEAINNHAQIPRSPKMKKKAAESDSDSYAIPHNDLERMLAELRMLELAVNRHHEAMRQFAEEKKTYPQEKMQDLLSLQKEVSEIRRGIKEAPAEEDQEDDTDSQPSPKLTKKTNPESAPTELEAVLGKLVQELHFFNREQTAIKMKLEEKIAEEKANSDKLRTQRRASLLVPLDSSEKVIIDINQLDALEAEYDSLVTRNVQLHASNEELCKELIEARAKCAAVRVKINLHVTPTQPDFQLNRPWTYRCEELKVLATPWAPAITQ